MHSFFSFRIMGAMTALHFAVAEGQIKMVQALVQFDANVNAVDEEGWTPLHFAAYFGRSQLTAFLIESGSDIDTQDNFQNTPLHCAASLGPPVDPALIRGEGGEFDAVIRILLEAGADSNFRDADGRTARDKLKSFDHYRAIFDEITGK